MQVKYTNFPQMDITKLREQINSVDREILKTLVKRFNLVKKIKTFKKDNSLKIEDKDREKEIISNLANLVKKGEISDRLIEEIWHAIFAESKRKQQ